MKSILKKTFLLAALGFAGMSFAQYYPNDDYYGNNNYGYEYYNRDFNYPDDYYYEFPDDYYDDGYYRNYYNDYRNTIISINWNRFFAEFRLSPYQIREIRMLNNRFSDYRHWNGYYRMNPDRWYYDRFYALERILGPRVYVVFYQRYYQNYNPIVYYQNYRVQHYHHARYVTPRYRNVDIRTYRNDSFRNSGFRNDGNYRTQSNREDNRNNRVFENRENSNDGFRTAPQTSAPRNERDYRSNGGFRNGNTPVATPNRSEERITRDHRNENQRVSSPERRSENSGFRSGGNQNTNRNQSSDRDNSRGSRN